MTEGTGEAGDATFTQADVDRIVRERLARDREKYGEKYKDYDDLKAKAGEADKHKSALDKLVDQVSGLEKRAIKAEAEALRAAIVQEHGLTARQAKYLRGASKDELEASAKEIKADLPEPAAKSDGQGGDGGQGGQAGDGKGEGGQGAAGEGQDGQGGSGSGGAGGNGAATRTRPREALRSGAAVPSGGAEETDPMKLAALVPRI